MDFLNDLVFEDSGIVYWAGQWVELETALPPEQDFLDSQEE